MAATMHDRLARQPRPDWCPLCQRPVTKWHEHHGTGSKWKPGA